MGITHLIKQSKKHLMIFTSIFVLMSLLCWNVLNAKIYLIEIPRHDYDYSLAKDFQLLDLDRILKLSIKDVMKQDMRPEISFTTKENLQIVSPASNTIAVALYGITKSQADQIMQLASQLICGIRFLEAHQTGTPTFLDSAGSIRNAIKNQPEPAPSCPQNINYLSYNHPSEPSLAKLQLRRLLGSICLGFLFALFGVYIASANQ